MPPFDRKILSYLWIGGCLGLILGSELAKREAAKRYSERQKFAEQGREKLDEWEQLRKTQEQEFIDRIADAVADKVNK